MDPQPAEAVASEKGLPFGILKAFRSVLPACVGALSLELGTMCAPPAPRASGAHSGVDVVSAAVHRRSVF